MDIVTFEKLLKSIPGSLVEYEDFVTGPGQNIMIAINRSGWYGVRILVERDPRIVNKEMFKISEHWTLEGARQKVACI